MKTYDLICFPEDVIDGYLIDEIHDRDKVIVDLHDCLRDVIILDELDAQRRAAVLMSACDAVKRYSLFVKQTRKTHGL